MSKHFGSAFAVALAVATVLAACSERQRPFAPTSPDAAGATSRTSRAPGGRASALGVVQRGASFDQDVSWSFVATPGGTTSSNAVAGLTIVFPAGAVSTPTTITVTAKAGAAIDYQFEPHGIQFAQPVTLTQELTGSAAAANALAAGLTGAYHASTALSFDAAGHLLVDELEPTRVARTRGGASVSFDIRHFSGYVVATGARDY